MKMILGDLTGSTEEGVHLQLSDHSGMVHRINGGEVSQHPLAGVTDQAHEGFWSGIGLHGRSVSNLGLVPVFGKVSVYLAQDVVEESAVLVLTYPHIETLQGRSRFMEYI
jgi:hypothetical protein